LAKKKEARFEEEGKGLGESAPDVNPANFEAFSYSDAKSDAQEIDLSPATSSIAVVASTAAEVEAEPAGEIETTKSRYSRRDSLRGEVFDEPEPAAMLTADRLLDDSAKFRPSPESGWRKFVYYLTLKLWNPGDSPKVKARKAMDARIGAAFEGGTKFIPVLTRKGGVGKTTISTLLGMALAQVREDRVIAIDANPDRGTLAERVSKSTRFTVRDVVNRAAAIDGFSEFSNMVSRDETRLDVLASDADPMLSEAFNEGDYNVVADMAARYYSVVITDCGTGIVHSVMRPTLQRASAIVIVSGGSVDEARLASETLTWLEANGYGELVRNSVVALNTATQATLLVKLDEIEQHFKTRVRSVIRIPYDPALAAGSVVKFNELKKQTRDAARDLAAEVIGSIVTPQ
jgi:MinD-like ATPase involved in chromosome partitioning or flagellar assembly